MSHVLPSRHTLVAGLPGVHIVPAPEARPPEVPFDEAVQRSAEERRHSAFVQGALAFDRWEAPDADCRKPPPTPRHQLPDPHRWAAPMAAAIVEVMTGARTAPQIVRWTTPEVYEVIARRGALAARRGARQAAARSRAVTLTTLGCEPAPGVAEVSAIVRDGARVRALAMRLRAHDGRWRIEVLEVG